MVGCGYDNIFYLGEAINLFVKSIRFRVNVNVKVNAYLRVLKSIMLKLIFNIKVNSYMRMLKR
jgi:hypothetical protein